MSSNQNHCQASFFDRHLRSKASLWSYLPVSEWSSFLDNSQLLGSYGKRSQRDGPTLNRDFYFFENKLCYLASRGDGQSSLEHIVDRELQYYIDGSKNITFNGANLSKLYSPHAQKLHESSFASQEVQYPQQSISTKMNRIPLIVESIWNEKKMNFERENERKINNTIQQSSKFEDRLSFDNRPTFDSSNYQKTNDVSVTTIKHKYKNQNEKQIPDCKHIENQKEFYESISSNEKYNEVACMDLTFASIHIKTLNQKRIEMNSGIKAKRRIASNNYANHSNFTNSQHFNYAVDHEVTQVVRFKDTELKKANLCRNRVKFIASNNLPSDEDLRDNVGVIHQFDRYQNGKFKNIGLNEDLSYLPECSQHLNARRLRIEDETLDQAYQKKDNTTNYSNLYTHVVVLSKQGSFVKIYCRSGRDASIFSQRLSKLSMVVKRNLFHKKFEITKFLGKGSFGSVYLVEGRDDKSQYYAAKVYEKKFLLQKKCRQESLIYEIRTLTKLKGTSLALQLIEIHETESEIILLTEYINGPDLSNFIHFGDNQSTEELMYNILLSLSEIASNGIVHRDLKLANILFENDDLKQVKIIDFGLSRFRGDKSAKCAGSPGYMAPESLNYGAPPSTYQDVFSIGIIFYYLLTGILPLNGDNNEETLKFNRSCGIEYNVVELYNVRYSAFKLLRSMLRRDPRKRISISQAINSKYFKNLHRRVLNRGLSNSKMRGNLTAQSSRDESCKDPKTAESEVIKGASPPHSFKKDRSIIKNNSISMRIKDSDTTTYLV